eukprot:SAG22_NODE_21236_length_258_cov_67.088050_1_plen_34_part_10
MSTVNDTRGRAFLALADGGVCRASAADALGPVIV